MIRVEKNYLFTHQDQLSFAELSGDFNPVHIDPLYARRTLFGKQIVHGINLLLKALDYAVETCTAGKSFNIINAQFLKPVKINENVVFSCNLAQDTIQVEILQASTKAASFNILLADFQVDLDIPNKSDESIECKAIDSDTAEYANGILRLYLNKHAAELLFPNLYRIAPLVQIAEILAATRLVGMNCPGKNSIFNGLDVHFNGSPSDSGELRWNVSTCSRRFSRLNIEIAGPTLRGRIDTFLRPEPLKQPDLKKLCKMVKPFEFAGQKALVIGGSRGLGEVTAKLLAAGGADVKITYFMGEMEANEIVKEISDWGQAAECFKFDVLTPGACSTVLHNFRNTTTLYYFATPFIFDAVKGDFSAKLFQRFCNYYVSGFFNTVKILMENCQNLQYIFYPSSIAVEEYPSNMCEYAAAKSSGEFICNFLAKKFTNLIVYKPRISRMATDQTASLLPVNNQDPGPVILEHLRCMKKLK